MIDNTVLARLLSSHTGPFVPYKVSVMPRNSAGCGSITTIDCFTQEGGGKLIIKTLVGCACCRAVVLWGKLACVVFLGGEC
jgi:hypothetical protein